MKKKKSKQRQTATNLGIESNKQGIWIHVHQRRRGRSSFLLWDHRATSDKDGDFPQWCLDNHRALTLSNKKGGFIIIIPDLSLSWKIHCHLGRVLRGDRGHKEVISNQELALHCEGHFVLGVFHKQRATDWRFCVGRVERRNQKERKKKCSPENGSAMK